MKENREMQQDICICQAKYLPFLFEIHLNDKSILSN